MQTHQKLHPMLWAAAIALILLSMTGIAALMGWLPGSSPKVPVQNETPPITAVAAIAPPPQPLAAVPPPPAAPAISAPAQSNPTQPTIHQSHPKKVATIARKPAAVHHTQASVPSNAVVVQQASSLPPSSPSPPPVIACYECGRIESINQIEKPGDGSSLGAGVGGALVGGVLGHQIGKGHGRDLATLAGAVGGAMLGDQIEKSARTVIQYEITVRFEDGTSRLLTQSEAPAWRMGDRVRVDNGTILAR